MCLIEKRGVDQPPSEKKSDMTPGVLLVCAPLPIHGVYSDHARLLISVADARDPGDVSDSCDHVSANLRAVKREKP